MGEGRRWWLSASRTCPAGLALKIKWPPGARVYAGVGAAAPRGTVGMPLSAFDGAREFALDGGAVRLDLPAGEGRAVIFDGEFVAGHGEGLAQNARGG